MFKIYKALYLNCLGAVECYLLTDTSSLKLYVIPAPVCRRQGGGNRVLKVVFEFSRLLKRTHAYQTILLENLAFGNRGQLKDNPKIML